MIITLGKMNNAVLVSDRRLTMPDGSWDDESNKAFFMVTQDARVRAWARLPRGAPRRPPVLTGSWSCCRGGHGVIAIAKGYPSWTGIGLPGVLVAVLIGMTESWQVT